jgi:membrane-bound ClpP family serine protease
MFVTVHNPITSEEMNRVKEVTEQARRRFREVQRRAGQDGPKIVFDFNPDNQASSTADYGPCRDLAKYLLSITDVTTIAFVHAEVTRHAVLPVLACDQLVMSSDGRIGDVVREPELRLPADADAFYQDDEVLFYKKTAERRGRSAGIVLKMLDKDLVIVEGTRIDDGGVVYFDSRRPPEKVRIKPQAVPVLPPGNSRPLTAEQAQQFGLCQLKKETRQELAEWYQMSTDSLRDDPLQGRTPVAWHVTIRGPLRPDTEDAFRRKLERAVGQRANVIFVEIACSGGDPVIAGRLAERLRTLTDPETKLPIMTVGYVTDQARDTAAFLALGCTYLVMHKDAHLGNFDRYLEEHPNSRDALRQALRNLAEKKDYPPVFAEAMVDPKIAIYRVRSKEGPPRLRFVSAEERVALGNLWEDMGQIKGPDLAFELNAEKAKEYGVSRNTVDNLDDVYQFSLGLERSKVHDAGNDWFDQFAAFFRNPVAELLLVMIGIACLVLEIKMPGLAVPGIISALCFLLFFWAHSQLAFTWLAVLMFLLGLALIGLEVFVVPGVAILGASGVALAVVGLGLATLDRLPQRESEWFEAMGTMARFGFALVGAVGAAFVVGRYLPHIPYASRLMLAPPDERGNFGPMPDVPPELARAAALLGAFGIAATTLRPAGMAKFGDDYVDVTAEGSFVEAGSHVQVIEVEANRIVVKEVSGPGSHG